MLRIEFDSDPAALARRFVAAIDPASRPVLVPDVVLVPTLGVGAWLERLVAERYGVAALLEVSLGGRYIWRALERMIGDLPARSPFEPERARWVIFEALADLPRDPDCEPLRSRVARLDARERFALASDIARCFDRYLAFRRDWLAQWGQGRLVHGADPAFVHERWQRWLWRLLLDKLPNVSRRHPFDRFRDVLGQARDAGDAALERLGERLAPGRIFVFGALSMSPEQFRLLAEFGTLRDIHWFAPDPSRDFWEHVVSPAEAARLAGEDPTQAWLFESEPAILGAWGKSQRDFLAQLRLLEGEAEVEVDDTFRDEPVAPARDALDALRKAVLRLDDGAWQELPAERTERSIEIHATHGEIRQAEVLHDRLLDAFESLPGLVPGDVVVYCSDVERFAPAIDAVFGSAPDARRLPYRIADRGPRADPAVRAVVHFLALARGRRDVAGLFTLLGNPLVRQGCGLDEEDVRRLARWLSDAGIHHDERAEPQAGKHGWQAGLERLVLGMLGNEAVGVTGGRRPVGGPTFADSHALERVLAILGQVEEFAADPRERSPAAWARGLLDWCDAMLAPVGPDAPGLARVREAVARVVASAAGIARAIPLEVFEAALDAELASGGVAARASGAITVCSLGALPGVPFRVTAILGMDDEAWPRRSHRLEFDLMVARPRFGDRLARYDDRGAFLDAVLATGDRLIALYTGSDARDDSPRNPSAQLRELIDYLGRCNAGVEVRRHGLQPFGVAAFDGGTPGGSFASEWLEAARAVLEPPSRRPGQSPVARPGWRPGGDAPVPEAGDAAIDDARLEEVVGDLASPAQSYCRHALRIQRPLAAAIHDPVAPFDPTAVDRALLDRALSPIWRGESDIDSLADLVLDAPWAPAGVGEGLMSEELRNSVAGALAARSALLDALGIADGAGESRIVRWGDADAGIVGRLEGIHDDRVQLLVNAFGAHPRALVDAWLRHVLWIASDGRAADEAMTILVHRDDGQWRATRVGVERQGIARAGPAESVRHALAWSRRIREEALPLFPRAICAVMAQGGKPEPFEESRALRKLEEELAKGKPWSDTESGAFAYEILWRAGLPDAEEVLAAGLAAYRPIFGAIGRSMTLGDMCKALRRP